MSHLGEARLGQKKGRMEGAAFLGQRSRNDGQGAAGRLAGWRSGRDGVDRRLKVLHVMKPSERVLGRAQGIDLPTDGDPAEIAAEFQHIPELLGGDADIVKSRGLVEGPRLPNRLQ